VSLYRYRYKVVGPTNQRGSKKCNEESRNCISLTYKFESSKYFRQCEYCQSSYTKGTNREIYRSKKEILDVRSLAISLIPLKFCRMREESQLTMIHHVYSSTHTLYTRCAATFSSEEKCMSAHRQERFIILRKGNGSNYLLVVLQVMLVMRIKK